MQRTGETSRARERAILRSRNFERVGHIRRVVFRIGEAARLASIEAPFRARGRPQIKRRQSVDLPCMRDRRDYAENPVRLVDARAVVRPDALQVLFDERDGRYLARPNGLLDLADGRLLQPKAGSPLRRRCRCCHIQEPAKAET